MKEATSQFETKIALLKRAINGIYGKGQGSTKVNVPDLKPFNSTRSHMEKYSKGVCGLPATMAVVDALVDFKFTKSTRDEEKGKLIDKGKKKQQKEDKKNNYKKKKDGGCKDHYQGDFTISSSTLDSGNTTQEGLFGVFPTKNLPSESSIQNWMLIELLRIIGGID
ncbi:hypothetical protein CMV_029868 [Castanea mollissima]|uniref:Uncharacterized protein n=1 Tax=Castanea mollissima TaxID=60419 RepID=A0A8J4VAH2_9ROSI|nr:hypothetical protein CMV_029868 [Castanea mollissima]